MKKKNLSRSALVVSIVLLIAWSLLGTGSTIAWFRDTASVINTFTFGEVDIELYRKTSEGYSLVDGETKLFDDRALYEPGYTQIIYLKVRNAGSVDFDYKLSVIPCNIIEATSVNGMTIQLPDYLKFGVVTAETEAEVIAATTDRHSARNFATTHLSNYAPKKYTLSPGQEHFCALIVCMPENVGNEANYRGEQAPAVELGIHVKAAQLGAVENVWTE